MSIKACAYINCENYVIDRVRSGSFTLFQFPKDLKRRKEWMLRGKISPHIKPSQLYICSDHFESKFISVNQCRTLLIGAAVPVAHCDYIANSSICRNSEDKEELEGNDCTRYLTYESVEHTSLEQLKVVDAARGIYEQLDKEKYKRFNASAIEKEFEREEIFESGQDYQHIRSTTPDEDEENYDNDASGNSSITNVEGENAVIEDFPTKNSSTRQSLPAPATADEEIFYNKKKRKISDTATKPVATVKLKYTPCNSTMQRVISSQQVKCLSTKTNGNKVQKTLISPSVRTSKMQSTSLVDTSTKTNVNDNVIGGRNVTTFMFMGEEYVMMPKSQYLQEKRSLTRKLMLCRSTLKIIKQKVNTLDLN